MSAVDIDNSLLMIIDIQEKLLNAAFNKDLLKEKAEILAKASDILDIPCIITEQYPKGLGSTITEISGNLPGNNTKYFEKTDFNALANAELLNYLRQSGKRQVILAGIETHICVRQTAEALIHEGFDISVIKDCCGSRAETEHLAGLDIMKQEGCFIKTTEMVLFELLKTAKYPKFKEVQALIK